MSTIISIILVLEAILGETRMKSSIGIVFRLLVVILKLISKIKYPWRKTDAPGGK